MTIPSITGMPSGEKATEVIFATDDLYLIQAAEPILSVAGKDESGER